MRTMIARSAATAVTALVLAAWAAAAALVAPAGAAAEPAPARRALLVGCTEYPHLPHAARWRLEGPANDVALLREVLTKRGFRAEDIAMLKGWPAEEALRPTRANIERHFKRLAEQSGQGDQVVVLLSGHGSQQPAADTPDNVEPDGLDELFLPADVKGWTGRKGGVANAVVDNELRAWLEAITAKGALLWVLVDSCHSGTMTRGAPDRRERYRFVPVTVLVPGGVVEAAQRSAAQRPPAKEQTRGQPGAMALATRGNMVAMFACQSDELAPELIRPPDGDNFHGLFTYTLAQVLTQSPGALTYRQLADRIVTSYRSQGRWNPTPLVEGTMLDRQVLPAAAPARRPGIAIGEPTGQGTTRVLAGALSGLSPLSVLSVYPPAAEKHADSVIGHVRLTHVGATTSTAEPVAFGGLAAPAQDKLKPGSRCKVAFVDFGDLRLKCAVQTQTTDASGTPTTVTHAAGKGHKAIEAALAGEAQQTGNLVRRVDDPAAAEWFVRLVDGQVYLVPAAGWQRRFLGAGAGTRAVAPPQFQLGAPAKPDELAKKLTSALASIARAQHLMHLARTGAGEADASQVELGMLAYKSRDDAKGTVLGFGTAGREVTAGDWVAFRVSNRGSAAADVTLLFIDSGYGISCLFPAAGIVGDNRLAPGKDLTTPRVQVTADTIGAEQLVMIAVRAGRDPVDFSCLEQATLAKARAAHRGASAMGSPLGRLLESAVYGSGKTRGLGAGDLGAFTVRLLPWVTLPAKAGASN